MSVKAALERGRQRLDKELKEKELDVQREGQKKSFVSSVLGSVSSLMPKGKYTLGNSPVWYKQYIKEVEAVTNIPTWLRVSQPNVNATGGKFSASSSIQLFNAGGPGLVSIGTNMAAVKPSIENQNTGSTARVIVHRFMPHPGVNAEVKDNGNYGYTASGKDWPINRATLMTITELGKVNSRAIPNDPSIPGMYLLSGTELYSMLAELKFIIDTVVHYQDNDQTIPDAIIEGKGYDVAEVRANLPSYRKMYRLLREAALSLVPMPDDFTLLARRIWMNTVIIRDSGNKKGCVMLFAQEAFGMISEDGITLDYSTFNNYNNLGYVKKAWTRVEDYLNRMISHISTNEDFLTLISNMRAANIKFAPIPELEYSMEYEIMADDEIKLQLQNIVTFPKSYNTYPTAYDHLTSGKLSEWKVTHDTSGYISGPVSFSAHQDTIATNGTFSSVTECKKFLMAYGECRILSSFSRLFNSFIGWDSDKMLVATRLHPLLSGHAAYDGDSKKCTFYVDVTSCGTELVLSSKVYCVGLDINGVEKLNTHDWYSINLSYPDISLTGTVYKVTGWGQYISLDSDVFRDVLNIDGFYPIYVKHSSFTNLEWDVSTGTLVTDSDFSAMVLFEADDFITIDRVDLARIHEVCVLSEYFIPAKNFGSFKR